MKRFLFTAAIIVFAVSLQAQFTYDYLKAADNYYKKADYYSAAEYYEKYLGTQEKKERKVQYNPYTPEKTRKAKVKTSSMQQAVYNLAESYRQLNYYSKAEPWYKQAAEFESTEFPLAEYYHAVTLRALERYDEAEKTFNAFLDEYKKEDAFSKAARKEIMSLRFVKEQLGRTDLDLFTVRKAPEGINTTGANYAPVWVNENTLLFTSTRPDSTATKNMTYVNRVYQAVYSDGVLNEVDRSALPQSKNMHQGVLTLTPDGTRVFLTRWTADGEKKTSAIYMSTKTDNGWSEAVMLDSIINVSGFNAQQPFMMPDGKHLLYASDKAGGMGGFDLWYAELDEAGVPVRTANLGSTLNTADDEQAPYYHAASKTLVFSGNGRVGMGGYDFFFSKGTIGQWSEPENFGYPVNSVKDDIYFVSRGGARNILEDVLLSTDRAAACCLELFSLSRVRPLKQVSGLVVACDTRTPISGATVNIIDPSSNTTVFSGITGPDGKYNYSIEDYAPLKAVAVYQGYEKRTVDFTRPSDDEMASMTNPVICLVKEAPPVNTVVVLENVYYDFDKSTLRVESFPALDVVVGMLNDHPNMKIEVSSHTDNKGSDRYNMLLSAARAKSVVDYLVRKGIDPSRLEAKGYGAAKPVAPNTNDDGSDNPEGRQQNRRTEFKVLRNDEM